MTVKDMPDTLELFNKIAKWDVRIEDFKTRGFKVELKIFTTLTEDEIKNKITESQLTTKHTLWEHKPRP